MEWLGFFLGSLIPTFLVSRILLWATREWDVETPRLVTCHAGSLLILAIDGCVAVADGDGSAGVRAAAIFAPAQTIWFLLDLLRQWRQARGTD